MRRPGIENIGVICDLMGGMTFYVIPPLKFVIFNKNKFCPLLKKLFVVKLPHQRESE